MKLILVRNPTEERISQESEELNRLLADEKLDIIFCSPRERTQLTMEGVIAGRDNEEIDIRFSKLIEPKGGGESLEELERRVLGFVEDLKDEFENNESVLVVSHKAVIEMIIFELTTEVREVASASVSILEIEKGKVKKAIINEMDSLD